MQLEEASSAAADLVVECGHQTRLADAGVAADQDPGRALGRRRLRRGAQAWRSRSSSSSRSTIGVAVAGRRDGTFADDAERHQGLRNSLHHLRFAGLEIEAVLDELPHLIRDHDRARIGEGLQPRADVRGEAVDVVLVEVEVDGPVVDPDAKFERLVRTGRRGQLVHRLGERQPRAHRPLCVVLVRGREAEDRKRAVPLEPDDVAVEAVLDHVAARVAIAPHQLAICLRLEATRKLGRADDVAVHEGEPAQLADASAEVVSRPFMGPSGPRTGYHLLCGRRRGHDRSLDRHPPGNPWCLREP